MGRPRRNGGKDSLWGKHSTALDRGPLARNGRGREAAAPAWRGCPPAEGADGHSGARGPGPYPDAVAPSIEMMEPLMKSFTGETKKTAVAAMCSGSPKRPSGMPFRRVAV